MPTECKPRLLPLALFTAAYMVAAVAGSMMQGNTEFIFYIVVMVVLISVMTVVHKSVGLTTGLLWALSVWGQSPCHIERATGLPASANYAIFACREWAALPGGLGR